MRLRSIVFLAGALLAAQFDTQTASAREFHPTVTLVDGASTIVSGAQGYLPAAGVRLRRCDIVRTGPQALVQVESEEGGKVQLGPDTRFVFELAHSGESAGGPHFLPSGWAKITMPRREAAPPYRVVTPHFAVLVDAGVVVLRISADAGQVFVEQGAATVQAASGSTPARVAVGAGKTYSRKAGQATGAVTEGVEPTFAASMPVSLRDTLPSLLPQLKARNLQPKPAPGYDPADAAALQRSFPELGTCFVDDTIRNAQQALQRGGFNVGPIDGVPGPRTQAAVREFQQRNGLTPSGELDAQTLKALEVTDQR